MVANATFQSWPNGYWVTATYAKGRMILENAYTLEEEFALHQENIGKGQYTAEDIEQSYKKTKAWCTDSSGWSFKDVEECTAWLVEQGNYDDIVWQQTIEA